MEKIEAHNNQSTSVIDLESGKVEFAVLIKAFHFKKALMQEHFNENYMESSRFPKATFKGEVTNISSVDFRKDDRYPVRVEGALTIRDVTLPLATDATLTVRGNTFIGEAEFEVTVADYGIEVPGVVRDNIAKTVRVTVRMPYEPLNRSVRNQ